MALKDWKIRKTLWFTEKKAWTNYDKKKGIFKNVVLSHWGGLYGVRGSKNNVTISSKGFDTMKKANEFAKDYMRSH